MNLISQKYEQLAYGLCAHKESIIKDAISHLIGTDWTIKDLTGRGCFSVYPNDEEVFSFDGVDLVIFYPPKTSVKAGIGMQIEVTQNYRLLYSKAKDDERR